MKADPEGRVCQPQVSGLNWGQGSQSVRTCHKLQSSVEKVNPRGRNVDLHKKNLGKLNEANGIGLAASLTYTTWPRCGQMMRTALTSYLGGVLQRDTWSLRRSSVAKVPDSLGLGLKSHCGGGWKMERERKRDREREWSLRHAALGSTVSGHSAVGRTCQRQLLSSWQALWENGLTFKAASPGASMNPQWASSN